MYQRCGKSRAILAFAYYFLYLVGLGISGYLLFVLGLRIHNWIYAGLVIVGILTAVVLDKRWSVLGFTEMAKRNWLPVLLAVCACVALGFAFSDLPAKTLVGRAAYYLIWIALAEELIFRGVLQNWLFGLRLPDKAIYFIGALFFAFMHIPFQMFRNGMPSLAYFLVAWPQLLFTAGFHLVMCFITYKRGDILFPVGIHFAVDFLQNI